MADQPLSEAPEPTPGTLRERFDRFEKSAAGRYWSHLSTADFLNSSFAFAALAVLSAFPFLAVSSSALGGDIRKVIAARMGQGGCNGHLGQCDRARARGDRHGSHPAEVVRAAPGRSGRRNHACT